MSIENKGNTRVELDFTSCPDWGKGGQFVIDPATGLRVRVQPELPPQETAPAENTAQEPETKKVTTKESRRG